MRASEINNSKNGWFQGHRFEVLLMIKSHPIVFLVQQLSRWNFGKSLIARIRKAIPDMNRGSNPHLEYGYRGACYVTVT
jgi:hypothetical protein